MTLGSPVKLCLAVLVASLLGVDSAPASSSTTVVMTDLDNPRGLALAKDGTLYVAEAGTGGDGPCAPTGRPFPEDITCAGNTGAVTRLRHGVQQRIVSGLPSSAHPTLAGAQATGPQDVSLRGHGGLYVAVGLGGGPAYRAALGEDFGWLIRVNERHGAWRGVTDVASYEFDANPGGGPPDSNPYGLAGGGRLVVDAGGNALLRVRDRGRTSTIATFPSRDDGRPTDSVPTCVAIGPDRAYYVGELTGVPFATGAARVYRVVPGREPEVFLDGFTTIIDLAFGPDGSLYVLQHSSAGPFFAAPGSLVRVAPDGTRTTVIDGLARPTGLVIGRTRHGRKHRERPVFFISNRGTSAGTGEVVRFEP
jgi:sugar lactone lactonase YvrE